MIYYPPTRKESLPPSPDLHVPPQRQLYIYQSLVWSFRDGLYGDEAIDSVCIFVCTSLLYVTQVGPYTLTYTLLFPPQDQHPMS